MDSPADAAITASHAAHPDIKYWSRCGGGNLNRRRTLVDPQDVGVVLHPLVERVARRDGPVPTKRHLHDKRTELLRHTLEIRQHRSERLAIDAKRDGNADRVQRRKAVLLLLRRNRDAALAACGKKEEAPPPPPPAAAPAPAPVAEAASAPADMAASGADMAASGAADAAAAKAAEMAASGASK